MSCLHENILGHLAHHLHEHAGRTARNANAGGDCESAQHEASDFYNTYKVSGRRP